MLDVLLPPFLFQFSPLPILSSLSLFFPHLCVRSCLPTLFFPSPFFPPLPVPLFSTSSLRHFSSHSLFSFFLLSNSSFFHFSSHSLLSFSLLSNSSLLHSSHFLFSFCQISTSLSLLSFSVLTISICWLSFPKSLSFSSLFPSFTSSSPRTSPLCFFIAHAHQTPARLPFTFLLQEVFIKVFLFFSFSDCRSYIIVTWVNTLLSFRRFCFLSVVHHRYLLFQQLKTFLASQLVSLILRPKTQTAPFGWRTRTSDSISQHIKIGIDVYLKL